MCSVCFSFLGSPIRLVPNYYPCPSTTQKEKGLSPCVDGDKPLLTSVKVFQQGLPARAGRSMTNLSCRSVSIATTCSRSFFALCDLMRNARAMTISRLYASSQRPSATLMFLSAVQGFSSPTLYISLTCVRTECPNTPNRSAISYSPIHISPLGIVTFPCSSIVII